TSFIACWMALATSARSILLTISKLLSGMECRCQNRRQIYDGLLNLQIVMLRDGRSKLRAVRIARPKHVLQRVTEEASSAKARPYYVFAGSGVSSASP